MKIKAIFVTLNVVLGVAFLVIFLTPVFMLGGDWAVVVLVAQLADRESVPSPPLEPWTCTSSSTGLFSRGWRRGLGRASPDSWKKDLSPRPRVAHACPPAFEHVPCHVESGEHPRAGDVSSRSKARPDRALQPPVQHPVPARKGPQGAGSILPRASLREESVGSGTGCAGTMHSACCR